MLDVVACSQGRYYLTKQLWGRSMVLAYHVAPGPEPYVRRRKPKMQLPSIPTGATTHLSLSIEKKSSHLHRNIRYYASNRVLKAPP